MLSLLVCTVKEIDLLTLKSNLNFQNILVHDMQLNQHGSCEKYHVTLPKSCPYINMFCGTLWGFYFWTKFVRLIVVVNLLLNLVNYQYLIGLIYV